MRRNLRISEWTVPGPIFRGLLVSAIVGTMIPAVSRAEETRPADETWALVIVPRTLAGAHSPKVVKFSREEAEVRPLDGEAPPGAVPPKLELPAAKAAEELSEDPFPIANEVHEVPEEIPVVGEPATPPLDDRPSYAEVYRSIPFSRAEYEANPSYRHEATMELLFDELRPMSIHKYVAPPPPSGIGAIRHGPPVPRRFHQLRHGVISPLGFPWPSF